MCGIAGYLTKKSYPEEILINMSNAIVHRGPDASGYWRDELQEINFCHLRLSILDLSTAGAQPMASKSGRYVVIFNGEVYNFLEIKMTLEAVGACSNWRGHSDTEIMLAGFEYWGISETINKMIGMFAIAVWDSYLKELYLIRDRIGEKPLYYGWQGEVFLFGSELKAITKHPAFENTINSEAVASFFKYNYIPAPLSIYNNINKLMPGTYCKISLKTKELEHITYWDLDEVINFGEKSRQDKITNENEYIARLENLLKDAVKKQMLADVPLGAFLSGGVDSSTIVALMQSQSHRPVKTFSIGFEEEQFNEAIYAKQVANHLGTDHTELYVNSQDALNVIPLIPQIYDEPFSDSSQIPTYLLSKLVRQHVTVSLSGDAGDELFAGYNRYTFAKATWNKLNMIPPSFRRMAGSFLMNRNPDRLNKFYDRFKFMFPAKYQLQNFGDKMQKAGALFDKSNGFDLYDGLISHWDPAILLSQYNGHKQYNFSNANSLSFIEQMMKLDTLTYLPDDILVKVDRASMANSLETRVPFLDHRVVEFAWQIPMQMKLKNGKGKWLLREILYKYVPKELIERPKMGFGVPLDSWLRGPLREWAEDLLSYEQLNRHGFLNYDVIKKKWDEHQSGQKNWQYHIWDVLMFQSWYIHNHN